MENPRLSKIQVSQAGHRSRAVVRESEAEGTCLAPGKSRSHAKRSAEGTRDQSGEEPTSDRA